MPNWNELVNEINSMKSAQDTVRKKYLKKLSDLTGRNIIVYYSGWLQKDHLFRQGVLGFEINDADKNGFMAVVNKLDRKKGLDLILHTPGGAISSTESLVNYLRPLFNNDIRAIIPQIAMSCGTMISCACKEIIMGLHSSLGPIDPQIYGYPAHGILDEYDTAIKSIKMDPTTISIWQIIIGKYSPTIIGECQNAIDWSNKMVEEWLETGMFSTEFNANALAKKVVQTLGSHSYTKTHSRNISIEHARRIGLKIISLEDDQQLQNMVLSVHHACIYTLTNSNAIKLIENQNGVSYFHHYSTP